MRIAESCCLLASSDVRYRSGKELGHSTSDKANAQLFMGREAVRTTGPTQTTPSQVVIQEKEDEGVCDSLASVGKQAGIESLPPSFIVVNLLRCINQSLILFNIGFFGVLSKLSLDLQARNY